jgi:hypothetical protein
MKYVQLQIFLLCSADSRPAKPKAENRQPIRLSKWGDMPIQRSAVSCLALSLSCGNATAQSVAEFYHAKQITFVIGTGEGGGYDL